MKFKVKLVPIIFEDYHALIGHYSKASERRNIILQCRAYHLYELSLRDSANGFREEFKTKKLSDYIDVEHRDIRRLFGDNIEALKNIRIWDSFQFKGGENVMPGLMEDGVLQEKSDEKIAQFIEIWKDHQKVMMGEIADRQWYEKYHQKKFYNNWERFNRAFEEYHSTRNIPSLRVQIRLSASEFWRQLEEYYLGEEFQTSLLFIPW
ncbi:MAG: hypothetical protein BAJALOKI1v1_400007 [Promethearchaeota archaeon]|nr:MAG: hypothetical protein BAJALOKI1v1_400007 [Candidatus Lokiarchaeota archaeon]